MKKRRCHVTLFCLSVVFLCYWQFVQYGQCSEQKKLDLQYQPEIKQESPEQQEESKADGKNDKGLSQDLPTCNTTENQTQTDSVSVELQIPENNLQRENEKDIQVSGTPAVQTESELDPVASILPKKSSDSQNTHLSPFPTATITASQSVDVLAATAVPVSSACSVGDESYTSTSLSAGSNTAACDAGENNQDDTDVNSPPLVLENSSTPGTGTTVKDGLGKVSQGTNASSMLKDQGVHITETDTPLPDKGAEDIPTFDEWKKIIMEVENEKSQSAHTSCNGASTAVKKVQKTTNYASVECGAKILSSNPEAKSTSAILMENVDVYMLNPCSNKIWFIIELCQPIQLKQLDIANFELFSSTPKDFLVSISDRYPTSKWSKLGTFHARDERTVQSFPLDEHLYAKYVKMFTKYVKVELLSHFGSEHFCPLSLIRVFGTSMMEEYELNSEALERHTFQDEDDDYPPGYVPSDDKSSKNLIGSAKDVIINMVNNIAANVLGGNPEDAAQSGGNFSSLDLNLTETSGIPVETVLPSSSSAMIKSSEADQHDTKLPETASLTQGQDEGQTVSLTKTPRSEASLAPESLSPTPANEEQIVILLPSGEESDELDQPDPFSSAIAKEEQAVKAEKDQQYSGLLENKNCCEHAPDSCSCVTSLEEYLLQCCFPLPAVQRKSTRMELQESQTDPGTYSQDTNTSSPDIVSSLTHAVHTWTPETSAVDSSIVVVPTFTGSKHKPEAESLDLEPSLTSAMTTLTFTDIFSSTATHAVDFLDPLAVDLPDLTPNEKVKDTLLPTSHLESTSNLVTITPKTDNGLDHEQKSLTMDNPSAGLKTSNPSVRPATIEEEASFSTLSSSTDLSFTQTTKSESAAPTGSLTAAPVTEPLDTAEPKGEDLLEESALQGSSSVIQPVNSGNDEPEPQPSTEFFADMQGTIEAQVHSTSQKESVFMRLNNRIKALEVNMSLSGRYLEQLSQRYRKQMEEMQKAFNKTIIKLQNTSRIAEEQDQKQTESILVLQKQLGNMTELIFNMSVQVSQLQREVSDRHCYLLLCLGLCMLICTVISVRFCRSSAENPSTEPVTSRSNSSSYCCPDIAFSGHGDVGPKRRASYPFLQSSMQIAPSQEPNKAYNMERNSSVNKKKKCRKTKSNQKPETVTAAFFSFSSAPNGGLQRPSHHSHNTNIKLPLGGHGPPFSTFRDSSSDGSSDNSSQSDEPSFCGIATCGRLCDTLPPSKIRSKKRSRLRKSSVLKQLLQPAECNGPPVAPHITLNQLIKSSSGSRVSQL